MHRRPLQAMMIFFSPTHSSLTMEANDESHLNLLCRKVENVCREQNEIRYKVRLVQAFFKFHVQLFLIFASRVRIRACFDLCQQ